MTRLRPFFRYYGSKWRLAGKYPRPAHDHIIEPFAGSAGYSLLYYGRNVTLRDIDPGVVAVWRYIIGAKPSEILALPDIGPEQHVDELGLPQEARLLVGAWLNTGRFRANRPSKNMRSVLRGEIAGHDGCWWGPKIRHRIAWQADKIRHWKIVESTYDTAPNERATWFVDPPYDNAAGAAYAHGSRSIDYAHLGQWCRGRRGQTIVCENAGASWLPFADVAATSGARIVNGKSLVSTEAMWTNEAA